MLRIAAGRILRINLTTGLCYQETVPPELMQFRLGGRGLGTALLSDFGGCDPLAPELPLIFTTGPLCNTPVPMSTRAVLTTRSPLSKTIISSTSGGLFARHLKRTGFAAIVVQGVSPEPCLLEIRPDGATILPAGELWGLHTTAAFRRLGCAAGAAVIGPAGERGVCFASIETHHGEPFSRGGVGAVMGHKRLKAIMVRGDAETPIVDQPAFDKALEDLMRLFRASPFLFGPFGIREQGTVNLVDLMAHRGMLPGLNFLTFSGDCTCWNAAAMRSRFTVRSSGCHDCLLACKRLLPEGTTLPDYDTLATFGGICGIDDLTGVAQFAALCSELGVDPVSAGSSIAAWSEITGQELTGALVQQLLVEITERTGQGGGCSYGAERMARQLGQPEKAMTVKGLELPPYDPRASTGLALAYATSPHGGSHLTAWPIASEILRKPVPTDRFSFDGKARIIAMFEDANAAVDSLALCRFASAAVELEEMAALLAAVTGSAYGPTDLQVMGRATIQEERAFNRACGLFDQHDTLPSRFFTEGANGLPPLDRGRYEQELAAYHRIRAGQCR